MTATARRGEAKKLKGEALTNKLWEVQRELKKIGVERYLEITQEAYDMSAFAK